LGKGIDALFGDISLSARPEEDVVRELSLTDIDPNREQPRKRFDQEEMERLADSIASVGVIQPITVHQENGRYTIIAGERRWRAARIAGLKTIPALVRDWDRVRRMEVALIENLQRQDLNPVEEALGIRHLMEECGLTQEATAKRLGRSRPAIANLLRLLSLPESVLSMLRLGELSEGHARAIAGLDTAREQEQLAMAVLERGMTVRQTEEAVRRAAQPAGEKDRPSKARDESAAMVEEAARRAFGTKVTVDGDAQRGKITIHYYSREDLERIYAARGGEEAGV
jgi:ParB family chromosome partitioning protein